MAIRATRNLPLARALGALATAVVISNAVVAQNQFNPGLRGDSLYSLPRSQEEIHEWRTAGQNLASGNYEEAVVRLHRLLIEDSGGVLPIGSHFHGLRKGVIVHVHDIFLPYDYQRNLLRTFLHWSETSLLRAYLTHNERVGILFCLSHLHYERPDELKRIFPEYVPAPGADGLDPDTVRPFEHPSGHFPSSIYLRTR